MPRTLTSPRRRGEGRGRGSRDSPEGNPRCDPSPARPGPRRRSSDSAGAATMKCVRSTRSRPRAKKSASASLIEVRSSKAPPAHGARRRRALWMRRAGPRSNPTQVLRASLFLRGRSTEVVGRSWITLWSPKAAGSSRCPPWQTCWGAYLPRALHWHGLPGCSLNLLPGAPPKC